MIPGKAAMSHLNQELQSRFGVTVTPTAIVDCMTESEIPSGIRDLVQVLHEFGKLSPLDVSD